MTSPSRTSGRGILYVVLAVTFWGGSASLAKYLFLTSYDPLIVSQTRSSLSFLLLAGYFLLVDRTVFRVPLREVYKFAVIGIVGIATTNFTYYYTIQESSVATAILIQNAAPVFVMLYAVIVSKEEELNGIKVLALAFALFGCFLAVSGGSADDIKLSGWAIITAPASMLTYAFMLVASKQMLRSYRVWTTLILALGFATVFWLFVNTPMDIAAKGYALKDWGIFLVFAVVSILLPYIFFTHGLQLLEASTTGIVTTLEPVIAITVAWATLGESMTYVQVAGTAAVVSSILLLQVRRLRFRALMRRDTNGK